MSRKAIDKLVSKYNIYKNITYKKSSRKWEVKLNYHKRRVQVGMFSRLEEAISIRDAAVWNLYKDDSKLLDVKNKKIPLPLEIAYRIDMVLIEPK